MDFLKTNAPILEKEVTSGGDFLGRKQSHQSKPKSEMTCLVYPSQTFLIYLKLAPTGPLNYLILSQKNSPFGFFWTIKSFLWL